jgi:hypothetical protein
MQNPQPRERDYFFVGSFYVFAIWISLGVAGIIEMIMVGKKELAENKTVTIGILGILFVAIPINMLYQNFDNHNRNGNYLAWDFSYNLLQSCPKDAILFCAGDNDTFPLWYLQDAEEIRRDVRIVNLSLINTDWYPLQMKNDTPYGAKKVPMTLTDDQIVEIARRQFYEWGKSQKIEILVPNEVYSNFIKEEKETPKEFKSLITLSKMDNLDTIPDKITIDVNSTFSYQDPRGQAHYGLRAQDIFMLNIIQTNNWERPICFYVGVPQSMRIGIDNYLRMEGLVYRLTPLNLNTRGEFINIKDAYEHLTKEPEGFSKDPQTGFKFRNLNKPDLYFDENGMRTAQDYRAIFTSIAWFFNNYLQDKQRAAEILSIMRKKVSEQTVTLDDQRKYPLLILYNNIGQKDEVQRLALDIEKDCLIEIERNPINLNSQDSPYRILLGLYEITKEYNKEIEIYNKLLIFFPNDEGIKNKINELRDLANKNRNISDSGKQIK